MSLRLSQHQACPARRVSLHLPFVHSASYTCCPARCQDREPSGALPFEEINSSTLETLAPVRVVVSRSINAYRPHAPHSRAHPDFTVFPLIRDALAVLVRLGDPGVVLCFRCSFLVDMPSSQTPGSLWAAIAQFFAHSIGLRQESTGSALPDIPSSASDEGGISWLNRFAFATACLLARPPGGSDRAFHPANGDFYSRAFDDSVTLLAVGYNYGGN